MKLTVRQVAKGLGVPEKAVYRWIDDGVIPVHSINEQHRFNPGEILEWATSRGMPVAAEIFEDGQDEPTPMLSEALLRGGIHRGVAGGDRGLVLRAVVDLMPGMSAAERETLHRLLLAREAMGSTAVGGGIAIPHARNPVVLHVTSPALLLCFLATPVDFAAPDGQPVDTVFSLVSANVRSHLHLLAALSAALHDQGFRAAVKERRPAELILAEARRVEESSPERSVSGQPR